MMPHIKQRFSLFAFQGTIKKAICSCHSCFIVFLCGPLTLEHHIKPSPTHILLTLWHTQTTLKLSTHKLEHTWAHRHTCISLTLTPCTTRQGMVSEGFLHFWPLVEKSSQKEKNKKKQRQDAEGDMALNKFSVLVSNVGTSGAIAKVAKCFFFRCHSRIMRKGGWKTNHTFLPMV